MALIQSGYGKIRIFTDFLGEEIPVANAVAYGTSAGGCNYYLGGFKVLGDLGETDTGVVALAKASGYARISGNNEDGKGAAIATETVFSASLNGSLIFETRVERQAVTAGVVFAGFCGTAADDIAEPLTATGTTLTLTAGAICGFTLDSQLTAAAVWHMPYNGGATTGVTDSTLVTSGVTAVAGVSDVLRLVIDKAGRAQWFINGVLKQTVAGAVSTTTLLAGLVGCWGTTTTAADVDCDYIGIEANRDWNN